MQNIFLLILVMFSSLVFADTPPPNTVKAKVWSGDGNTQINATGNSLDTFFTNSSLAVTGTFWQSVQPVSGTFWQATQPISAVSLPLPTGAATAAGLSTINTTLGSPFQAGGSIGNTVFGATQSGTWSNTVATPTALTVHQAAVTVGTSAVRLTYNGSAPASTRVLLVAQLSAASAASCYMGSSAVTTSTGIQMYAGQTFSWNHDAGDYYAICGSAGQTFNVVEQE